MISKEDFKIVEKYAETFKENILKFETAGGIPKSAVFLVYQENLRDLIQELFSKTEIEYLSKLPSFIEEISEEKAERWKKLSTEDSLKTNLPEVLKKKLEEESSKTIQKIMKEFKQDWSENEDVK